MADQIKRFFGEFVNGTATLDLPIASVTVAMRFYFNHPANPPDVGSPAIGIVVRVGDDIVSSMPGNYQRSFMMVPEAADLPANFSKYIATIPTDAGVMHVVEVHVANPAGVFNHNLGQFMVA